MNRLKLPDDEKLSYFITKSKVLNSDNFERQIRVAVLGSFTLNGLEETIRVKCFQKKIKCVTFVGGYNQYNQEILKKNSNLYEFAPDVTFLILDTRHILGELFFSSHSISKTEKENLVQQKSNEILNLVKSFSERSKSKIIISNLSIPTYSPYGINELKQDLGIQNIIYQINSILKKELLHEPSAHIFDLSGFISKHGENNVFDHKQFFYGDLKISIQYIPSLAEEFMGYIKAIMGLNKKCIVLDLDNTLWGGIIGEDGFNGIKLGDDPIGRSFVEFQRRLLALNQRGIILAINSKNNYDDAIEVIKKHPNMILREENFASIKINWNDKVSNQKEIVEELNIGSDSMVFFDDDPINREYMKKSIPEVLTPDIPNDSSQYAKILMEMNDFEILNITEEDTQRHTMYNEQRKRTEFQTQIADFDEFLKQLNVSVNIKKADDFTIPRISQLTLKTNQFNLTTRRYQEEEIRKFAMDDKKIVRCAEIIDKFGNNGITGVYIVNKNNEKEWIIDTFLLSCRVMSRGVEDGILSQIIQKARNDGVKIIKGEFIPTKKNKPAENFYENFGFKKQDNFWIFDTNQSIKKPTNLKMKIENE